MNYRHSYHAGNAADVFKHAVLALILAALRKKDTPFCVIDSHAGGGVYALKAPGEFQQGIALLWPERARWRAFADYIGVVEKYNRQDALKFYPGSPLIIREFLRAQDRAVLLELHPEEYAALQVNFDGVKNIALHHADAWSALRAFVPPRENRGLVLIDPPYERADEFEQAALLLKHGAKHWRNGIYMVWYPVKQRRVVERLHRAVRDLKLEAHAVELTTLPTDVETRLNGSGLVLINSPWKLLDTLRVALPPLAERLAAQPGSGKVRFIDLTSAVQTA